MIGIQSSVPLTIDIIAKHVINSIISSPAFKFLVGADKRLFTVHAGLVAHLSKPLAVLINGPMSEAQEGCAWLEDVDEHTFVRFSQYAYTGDYRPADPDILLDSNSIAATYSTLGNFMHGQNNPEPVAASEEIVTIRTGLDEEYISSEPSKSCVSPWGISSSKKDKKKCLKYNYQDELKEEACPRCLGRKEYTALESKKSKLWDKFKSRVYITSRPDFKPRRNQESCEDYTGVFLCHARLYVFAEMYDIHRLRELSLHNLQRTLTEFTLYSQRLEDIIDLMQYTYLNTAEWPESIDPLRSLVIHYAACVVEDLAQSTQFRRLMEEMGQLARDLMGQLLKRLD
jgi:hypothetical protein